MLYSLFYNYGNAAGFALLVVGAVFYLFSEKIVGQLLLAAGALCMLFYYVI